MRSHLRPARGGFTLVELLVVIGIIALLIGILLPSLSKARESAKQIKCASNLHSIGVGMANYVANFHGVLPPSNIYNGLQVDYTNGVQNPSTPTAGYLHWSAFLFNNAYAAPAPYNIFRSAAGWGAFQCPSLDNGGLPPANTFAGNNDFGLTNDAGSDVIDLQAPRLAYTVNEALCPRGYFIKGITAAGYTVNFPYHFVQASRVRSSAEVILATEIGGFQGAAVTDGLVSGSPSSNSRRPVSGVVGEGFNASYPFAALNNQWYWAGTSTMHTAPQSQISYGTSVQTTLDYIGLNHGSTTTGHVGGDTRGGWDLRTTNFLYVDGHVENKHVSQTVYPKTQWGDQFYTLDN